MRLDRERISRVVLGDLKRANSFFEEKVEPLLLERRAVYLSQREFYDKKYPQLSKKSDYRSFDFYAYVQWAKPSVLSSFFGSSRIVSIVGQGNEDEKAASVMEKLVNWQIVQQCRGYTVFDGWIEDALIYELGILKCWWERSTDTEEVTEVFPLEKMVALFTDPSVEIVSVGEPDFFGDYTVRYKKQAVTSNRPVIDNISPFDLRWSKEARTLGTANFVAQRQLVTVDTIRRGIKEGLYDKTAAEEAIDSAGKISYTTSDYEQNPEFNDLSQEDDEARRLIELYECYVKLDPDGSGLLKPMIVTVANDKVIRVAPNTLGRLPFFNLCVHRDSRKVMPELSMADVEGELQHLRTAIIRQMLVNLSLSNKARKFVDETKVNVQDLLDDTIYVRVNGDPTGCVVPEQPMQIAGWTMSLIEYLKGVEEEWSGKTRYNQGMDAKTLNQTATGITAIMQAASQRINYIIQGFGETGFAELDRFLVYLNQRYIDQNQVIRVFNEPLEIAPDDLQGDLDIVVKTDVGLGEKQQTLSALGLYITQGYPALSQIGAAGPADFAKACIRFLELSGLKDATDYVRPPEEVEALAQQQQQLQQLAGGIAGQLAAQANGGGAGSGMPGMVSGVRTGNPGPGMGGA